MKVQRDKLLESVSINTFYNIYENVYVRIFIDYVFLVHESP